MQGISRKIVSNQQETHPDLKDVVLKHWKTDYNKPFSKHSREAFELTKTEITTCKSPLIFDSGCGNASSTEKLAANHPEHFVIGIDKSFSRIGTKIKRKSDNCLIVRADLIDFWRLAHADNWKLDKHYLLYPNPWPKKKHLMRRWHGHPVFRTLLALGGEIILRSNWLTYAEEFAKAIEFTTGNLYPVTKIEPKQPLTPFERKYQLSSHALYQYTSSLESS